jgi:hypothetical protein
LGSVRVSQKSLENAPTKTSVKEMCTTLETTDVEKGIDLTYRRGRENYSPRNSTASSGRFITTCVKHIGLIPSSNPRTNSRPSLLNICNPHNCDQEAVTMGIRRDDSLLWTEISRLHRKLVESRSP